MIWRIFDYNVQKRISKMKDYFIEDNIHTHTCKINF